MSDSSNRPVMGAAALDYAARGWRVFPLRGKQPLIPKSQGGRGCLDATTDDPTISEWWAAHPTAGVGLHAGPGSGFWVLDVDAGTEGPAALAALEVQHGPLPRTATVRTGGGGLHYYWRCPPGRTIKNRVGVRSGGARVPGLDVRSEGGYVVAPPSLHPDGGAYAWVHDCDPVDAPAWLLDLVSPPAAPAPAPPPAPYRPPEPTELEHGRRYAEAALRHACERIAALTDGRREALVRESFAIGGFVGAGVLDRGRAEAELVAAGVASGTKHDVHRVVAYGLDTGAQKPTPPPPPQERPVLRPPAPPRPPATPPVDDLPPVDAYDSLVPQDVPGEPAGNAPADDDERATVDALLQWVKKGEDRVPKRNDYNLGVILRHDPAWSGRLRFNAFRDEDEVLDSERWRALRDVDDVNVCRWVAENYRLDYRPTSAREQIMAVCDEHRAHPVLEFLGDLRWDGVPRMDSWLGECLGVQPSVHAHAVGRAFLVSMVARAYEPGCKVDTVAVFAGEQGARKSSTLAALVPDRSWFFDSQIEIGSKDAYQVLRGKWLIEIPEIDQFSSKQDASRIKAYVSAGVDTYRASYGRRTRDVPRQTVFCGTTNAREFLVDPTGSRRFWLVETGACSPERMAEIRDQLWAEAVHAYRAGERWYLSRDLDAMLAAEADRYRVADVWEPAVRDYVDGRLGLITVAEILVGPIGMNLDRCDKAAQMRVAGILTRLGFRKVATHTGRGWVRP